MVDTSKCPCGSDNNYKNCCEPLHTGTCFAKTAEELMRSRYCAYIKKHEKYLLDTWYRQTRPKLGEQILNEEAGFRWLGLKIISTEKGGANDTNGKVCFIASYRLGSRKAEIREESKFIKEDGRWYYVHGV